MEKGEVTRLLPVLHDVLGSVRACISLADPSPAAEMIPFAGFLALVGVRLFRLAWLRIAFAIFLPLNVLLVSVLHLRARHRLRKLGLPAAS